MSYLNSKVIGRTAADSQDWVSSVTSPTRWRRQL